MIKSAGTTFNYILRNNYGRDFVGTHKEPFTPEDLRILLSFNKNIKAIAGHHLRSFTGLDSVGPHLKYITFLRDPIGRHISHYNHAKIRGYHRLTLEEWTEKLPEHAELNYNTKFIAGSEDLGKAKKILAEDFAFVGLTENFDESLILMKQRLNLQNFDIRYQRGNVSPKTLTTKSEISDDFMQELRALNRIDYELYRFVQNELFEKQKCKYGNRFIDDLDNFRHANENYRFSKFKIWTYKVERYWLYKRVRRM
jgi:hypothetical protein